MKIRCCLGSLPTATNQMAPAQSENPPRQVPDRTRPDPRNHDVLVYRLGQDGTSEKLAAFKRAGVPTVRIGNWPDRTASKALIQGR